MRHKIGELTFLEKFAGRFNIPVPEYVVEPVSQSEVKKSLEKWGEGIVKPDVLCGKRGKAGTIRRVSDFHEAVKMLKKCAASAVMEQQPRTAYMVQSVPSDFEVFSAVTYSSKNLGPALTISLKGGMDIESVPESEKATIPLNVFRGLNAYQSSEALTKLGLEGKLNSQLALNFVRQWDMFIGTGMSSCEINPWRVTNSGSIYACDFKATFDDNNFKSQVLGFEFPEYPTSATEFEEEMAVWSASSHRGQAHVSDLGGRKILPMLFGGGASTITIETLSQFDGDPMFLSDFGGNPPYDRMKGTAMRCFEHRLADASLLLILGGTANNTQIDITFSAIADALEEWVLDNGPLKIPVVIGRGGPGLVRGLIMMKKALENIGCPYVFFGPDTPLTLVAAYAAELANFTLETKRRRKR